MSKSKHLIPLLGLAIWLGGCANIPKVPAPGLDHPANPDAPAAPLPPRSVSLDAQPSPPIEDTPRTESGHSGHEPEMQRHQH